MTCPGMTRNEAAMVLIVVGGDYVEILFLEKRMVVDAGSKQSRQQYCFDWMDRVPVESCHELIHSIRFVIPFVLHHLVFIFCKTYWYVL